MRTTHGIDVTVHQVDLRQAADIDLTRLVYAQMKARGHGVIINDIGAAGERPDFDYIAAVRATPHSWRSPGRWAAAACAIA